MSGFHLHIYAVGTLSISPRTGIWQILLDFTGGTLSDLQLVFDCWDMNDWTGITGNLAKFFLGFVSIVFDTIFMLQHYVLYPDNYDNDDATGSSPTSPTAAAALIGESHSTDSNNINNQQPLVDGAEEESPPSQFV